MSEASIYCTGCGRWWRPEQIAERHKRHCAPDGGPSGRCRECIRAEQRRRYQRLRADAARYEAHRERRRESERRKRASMTVDERRAMWRRAEAMRDKEREAERKRRYYLEHRDEICARRTRYIARKWAEDTEWRTKRLAYQRAYRLVTKARRFAARLAAARTRSDAAD